MCRGGRQRSVRAMLETLPESTSVAVHSRALLETEAQNAAALG